MNHRYHRKNSGNARSKNSPSAFLRKRAQFSILPQALPLKTFPGASGFGFPHIFSESKESIALSPAAAVAYGSDSEQGFDKLEKSNTRPSQIEETTSQGDAILNAISYAARKFTEAQNFQDVLQEILQRLGPAFGANRAYLVKHHEEVLGEDIGEILGEWVSKGIKPYLPLLKDGCFSYEENNLSFGLNLLRRGQPVIGSVRRLPLPVRRFLQKKGIASILLVPVMLEEKLWGFFGLDHHDHDKEWKQASEIDSLETVARILGASIHNRKLEEILFRSREKYREVVDNQTEIICQHLADGTIIFVNDGFCRCFERDRKDLLGQDFFNLVMPEQREDLQKILCGSPKKGGEETIEVPLRLPSGGKGWFNFSTKALSLYEYQTVGSDISAQKQAEETLHNVLKEKEMRIEERTAEIKFLCESMIQSEKLAALGLLVSGIAHEINNPNNFITLNMEILQEYLHEIIKLVDQYAPIKNDYNFMGMTYHEFKKDLFNLLVNIQNGSKRINATVTHLRKFARPENKQEKGLVNVQEVVEQAVKICGAKIKKYVKRMETDIPHDIQPIFTNPFTLEQVLINLIINAADSADKQDAWVKVGVESKVRRKNQLVLYVADNGCGIPEKEIDRIFTPFFTTKQQGKGMGLGLFISQNMIGGLGGQLTVESEAGRGSCFRIILPR